MTAQEWHETVCAAYPDAHHVSTAIRIITHEGQTQPAQFDACVYETRPLINRTDWTAPEHANATGTDPDAVLRDLNESVWRSRAAVAAAREAA